MSKYNPLIFAIACLCFAVSPLVRSMQLGLKLKPVDLASLRGKVVLIDFWATWCGPCMGEVPNVVATYRKLHEKGFEIVGISLDEDRDRLDAVTNQMGMTWPQYFDGKGWGNEIATQYGIRSIPTMWLIDKNGKLADANGREGLEEKVEKLLAK